MQHTTKKTQRQVGFWNAAEGSTYKTMAFASNMSVVDAHNLIAAKGNLKAVKDQYGLYVKPLEAGDIGTWMKMEDKLSEYNLANKVLSSFSSSLSFLSLSCPHHLHLPKKKKNRAASCSNSCLKPCKSHTKEHSPLSPLTLKSGSLFWPLVFLFSLSLIPDNQNKKTKSVAECIKQIVRSLSLPDGEYTLYKTADKTATPLDNDRPLAEQIEARGAITIKKKKGGLLRSNARKSRGPPSPPSPSFQNSSFHKKDKHSRSSLPLCGEKPKKTKQ